MAQPQRLPQRASGQARGAFLKVFRQGEPRGLSPAMSLVEFYREYVRPSCLRPAGAARRAIESIRTDRERIFEWPHDRRELDRERERLQKIAGIRQIGFHGVRKRLASELLERNPAVAQKALGHAALAMTRDFYGDKGIVAKTMEEVSQPKRKRARRKDDPRQRRLF